MADIDPRRELVVDLTEEEPAAAGAAADVVVVQEDGAELAQLPARARPQDDGSVVLPLLFPVTLRFRKAGGDQVREERIAELRFHRMTGADMRAIAAAGTQAMVVTLARSARIPEGKFGPILDRMDAADVDDAFAVVGRFLGNGRRTGR